MLKSNLAAPLVARDLETDLILCEEFIRKGEIIGFLKEAEVGWPYAIRELMKAKQEISQLKAELQVYHEQERGVRGCWD